jgi:hypothetical protein
MHITPPTRKQTPCTLTLLLAIFFVHLHLIYEIKY